MPHLCSGKLSAANDARHISIAVKIGRFGEGYIYQSLHA